MPLLNGKSKATISKNIEEFHKGSTFKHTEQKFGKEDADKQAIAAAFSKAKDFKQVSKIATARGDQKWHKKNIIRDPVDYEDQRYS